MRILHICQDELFLKRIKSIIESTGDVCISIRSTIGLASRLEGEILNAIIISDIELSDDFLDSITEYKKDIWLDIPIIFISNEVDFNKRTLLYERGIMTCLQINPFNRQRFIGCIESIRNELALHADLERMSIAVVDDSRFSLEVIKGFFSLSGIHHVDFYQNSAEFIKTAKRYDMYLIDYVMPEFDGEDLINHIRHTGNDGIIIVITSYGDLKTIPHCLNMGADDFILKPLDYKLFMLRIGSCVKQYRLTHENHQKTQMLYDLATKDALTGVYNRTFLMERNSHNLNELIRNSQAFSLIMIDIDHFKNVNDEHGHMVGDIVLKEMAHILEKNLRGSDIVCRWGGEEFIVLCSDTSLDQAVIVAEKLRYQVDTYSFFGAGNVTISAGVTQWRKEDDKQSAFTRLDNSLYLAKLTGRNKVVANEEIQIQKSGLPVTIEWGPFFRSGHKALDAEHQTLITLSNEIILHCFTANSRELVMNLFERLMVETVAHFRSEEKLLEQFKYDKLHEHKAIHDELILAVEAIKSQLDNEEIRPVQVAKYLIQEVVVGHIIKSDFEFFDIFSV